jgi:citronellol/citronellal dehydrogenase
MLANGWGHLLFFSPQLHCDPSAGKAAYMLSKLGMTRIAISIAEEHRDDNIASNALWPVTLIESLAVINNHLGDSSQWRKPRIICDAVSELFSREPASCTGRQLTDEQILTEAGITNFDHYWVEGAPPEQPMLIAGPDNIFK